MSRQQQDPRLAFDFVAIGKSVRLQNTGADHDDVVQEAAIGAWLASESLDLRRSQTSQLAFLRYSAKGRALNYLKSRGRQKSRFVPVDPEIIHETAKSGFGTPEDEAIAIETEAALVAVLERALGQMSAAEREMALHQLGIEPMSPELQQQPSSTRSSVAFKMRRKLLLAASQGSQCAELHNAIALFSSPRS